MSNGDNVCLPPEREMRPKLNIFKFGGSCFKNQASFKQSEQIVKSYQKNALIVVCSALNGITDKLIEFGNSAAEPGEIKDFYVKVLAEIEKKHRMYIDELFTPNPQLQKEMHDFITRNITLLKDFVPKLQAHGMSPENSDYVVAFGERMSSFLFSRYLKMTGYDCEFVPTDENFLITNEEFSNALPINSLCEANIRPKLDRLLKKGTVVIIPGFYGSTKEGKVTTLGRGGSDFTTTIIGFCMANDYAVNVIFWKDVYGILCANPNYVPNAKLLKQISYGEAKELTYFGSKVLHPKCLKMAEQRDCSVEIRNFTDPSSPDYTVITKECIIPRKSSEIIKGITSLDKIALVTVESDAMISLPGSAAKIFSLMGHYNININFISQCSSENNITFGTSPENGIKAGQILSQKEYSGKFWANVKVESDVSLLSVVGGGMIHKPGVAGLLFTTLGNAGINIKAIAQGSSEMNITLVIASQDLPRAIKTIYSTFIDGNLPTKISSW
jgi:aspartate kinase